MTLKDLWTNMRESLSTLKKDESIVRNQKKKRKNAQEYFPDKLLQFQFTLSQILHEEH